VKNPIGWSERIRYLAIRLRTNHTDSTPIHVINTATPNGNDRIMNHPITESE
jgi:hypothetical protein